MKTHSSKQIIIVFSVIVLALLAAHYFVFSFIKNTAVEVLTLEREVDSLQAQVLELSKYTPDDLKKLATSVTDKFISSRDFVDFIQSIEAKGRASNLQVTVKSVDTEKRSEDASEDDNKELLRLMIETNGSWANTLGFVNYLEHLPYKLSVQGLRLTSVSVASADAADLATTPPLNASASAVSVNENSRGLTGPTIWKAEIEITALKIK